jgi:hypothetical protein
LRQALVLFSTIPDRVVYLQAEQFSATADGTRPYLQMNSSCFLCFGIHNNLFEEGSALLIKRQK